MTGGPLQSTHRQLSTDLSANDYLAADVVVGWWLMYTVIY